MADKLKILFLCTGNSCRSQIAQGWAKILKKDTIEAFSAGVQVHGLNPDAVKVMAEAGVDISDHRSKHVREFKDIQLDLVITVCGHAREACPYFPGPWPGKCTDTPGYLIKNIPDQPSLTIDITQFAQNWYTGSESNHGLLLLSWDESFEHENIACLTWYKAEIFLEYLREVKN